MSKAFKIKVLQYGTQEENINFELFSTPPETYIKL